MQRCLAQFLHREEERDGDCNILSSVDEDPQLLVFLDLSKAYDNLD